MGEPLSIYEIQFTTDMAGRSDHEGGVVDCVGGIVVGKYAGSRPRVILQDPTYPEGWGGIQVKDWTITDLFESVQVGDWVELTNVKVEEFRGTTLLQWQTQYFPSFRVISRGNPLPPPLVVSAAEIPAPIGYPGDEWYVVDHDAERYESMRVAVRLAAVTRMHLGKAADNYNLKSPDGEDCWAADYMNGSREPSGYHEFVGIGVEFCAVVGILEQYTYLPDGWDYYQLLTMDTGDLVICGDHDSDTDVDLADWPRLALCHTGPLCDGEPEGCNPPAWTWPATGLSVEHCLMMDMDGDGDVDLRDVAGFEIVFDDP
jgi:hypothetical protein